MEKLYSCRKCALCCLLVLFVILSTEAVSKINCNYDFDTYKVFDYKTPLVLHCNVTLDPSDEQVTVSWLKNDKIVTTDDRTKSEIKGTSYTLTTTHAAEAEAGNYTIVVKGATELRKEFTTVLKPLVKAPANLNVVEGEKLQITCNVFGVPVPKIYWIVANATYTDSMNRVKLLKDKEKGVPNAVLQIEAADMDDREIYTCVAETQLGSVVFNATSQTFVRIKDKMAALWPFLGICLEVVVLCTVILVYEKKRNKTEMEESDTDGSPEQKNTPDHGKDSDVRHRK